MNFQKATTSLVLALTLGISNIALPSLTSAGTVKVIFSNSNTETKREAGLTMAQFLQIAFERFAEKEQVPDTYRFISLNFLNIKKGTSLYTAMQKGVYMNFIENTPTFIPLNAKVKEKALSDLVKRVTGEEIDYEKNTPLTRTTLLSTIDALYFEDTSKHFSDAPGYDTLDDAYLKLKNEFYDSKKVTDEALIRGAITGMTEATGDKHTVYFPPTESQSFQDELSGEYEGIGAYVDMQEPGVMKIVSPMPGSPAEKAGLKGGDIIKVVDDFVIGSGTSLQEAVSHIKWPSGSSVTLQILRGGVTMEFKVNREKLTIEFVNYSKTSDGIPVIKITTFGAGVAKEFDAAIAQMRKEVPGGDKLIIDLRNNPGGSLDEVSMMLSHFVPAGEDVVKIRYRNDKSSIVAAKTEVMLNKMKIAILINEGSASASEIMAGTIKDYIPETKLVGEKSYGKGSVQNFAPYDDGSSIKYTIAKWFTGKSETGIDGVGIKPDIVVVPSEIDILNKDDIQMKKAIEAVRGY